MKNTLRPLTQDEAYDAMYDFLYRYYYKTDSDHIGDLLSDMSLLVDGSSADPAALEDWNDSVARINNQKPKTLTVVEAYKVMVDDLSEYRDRIESKEAASLLSKMVLLDDGITVDPATWEDWMISVHKILNQNPRVRPMLILTK